MAAGDIFIGRYITSMFENMPGEFFRYYFIVFFPLWAGVYLERYTLKYIKESIGKDRITAVEKLIKRTIWTCTVTAGIYFLVLMNGWGIMLFGTGETTFFYIVLISLIISPVLTGFLYSTYSLSLKSRDEKNVYSEMPYMRFSGFRKD